jgi:triosephosphate isomerase (TIM)
MRKQIAAANWKMNLTLEQGKELLTTIAAADLVLTAQKQAVFAVPFPYLAMAKGFEKANFSVAAQNCSDKKSGAYTGETSIEMLQSLQIGYVVIGHSERREYFNESNAQLAAKTDLALTAGMTPIFCCGEPLPVREANEQNAFVAKQLRESLFHLSAEQMSLVVIAYEPIWAIGTGKTATAEQAQEMHAHIRQILATQFGDNLANEVSILYGGSVKAANAKEIFGKPDVDGGLVGGASLVAAEFINIINSLK